MTWSGSVWFPALLPIGPPQNTANTGGKGKAFCRVGETRQAGGRGRERENTCVGKQVLLDSCRGVGTWEPRVPLGWGWSRLVVGPLGHLTSSKLDWVLERPSFVYRGVAGPEPKTVSGP